MAAASRNRAAPPTPRSRRPASVRSGTRPAVEARLDPSQEQSRLGTSLSKSLPLNQRYSLTLQNGYNVTQQGVVPVPGLVVERPQRNYATDQSATLSMTETGTSLIAGQSLSSAEDRWLRKFGVEQKVFGGVSIAGTVAETPLGGSNKSLTAGFTAKLVAARAPSGRGRRIPIERSSIAAYWPRCGQIQRSRWPSSCGGHPRSHHNAKQGNSR